MSKNLFGLMAVVLFSLTCFVQAQSDLVQVKQDFSTDPGWEGVSNRVEASDPPMVKQDFGWSPGKIGGTVWKSTTPAWYGQPLTPALSFRDKFSASGKIAVMPGSGTKDAAYLGFFNHERQGWRPYSTMAIRLTTRGDKAYMYIDFTTALWNAGAAETEIEFPVDGSQHKWKLSYDPDATRAPWTDTRLYGYLTTGRQTVDDILAKAKKVEPDVTAADLEKRLDAARSAGLVNYLPRHGQRFFLLKQDKVDLKGAVSIQVDDGPVLQTFLETTMRDQPVVLDRFGIYNFQVYTGMIKFFISDLTVNDKKIDLSTDPGWDGKGNHAEYAERDFQRQNFGYSPETNFAGQKKGEVGGQFYNVEPIDPLHGYYADDVGKLTLDDPIHFSGKICYLEGGTDAGMFFGFFRAQDERAELPPNAPTGGATGWPQPNVLGVVIDGPARIGWWFNAVCTAADRKLSKDVHGPVFLPTHESRSFDFNYDPQANKGVGQVTVTLDKETFKLDLTAEQRKAGATFDRFGMMSFRRGGKFEILYLDDLTYTARRPANYQPIRHTQETVTVPYPAGGRKY